jgi:xanthine dehydrogenase molybdopterin-binding subunit B
LTKSSDYFKRRKEIENFNSENEFYKKGLAMTPVKFGISFTTSFLNQAGALVNIYQDGTILVNHGGTEMGQGLNTKMMEVAAAGFGIDIKNIKVNATNTSKIPNTSATAASSGSDLNGMAVKNAIEKLKKRLAKIALKEWNYKDEYIGEVVFKDNMVYIGSQPEMSFGFEELIKIAYLERTSLSATGFYKTPDIYYNRDKGKGKPFHYFAFGMSVSEVLLDTLTGYVELLRTDILHDVGKSINEHIDIGQIEGAFVQGLGWVTTEDMKYSQDGNLLNHSPDTYKIPTIADIPKDFRVEILKNVPNPNTIRQSKAVGEPPFMHAFSVWLAIKDAVSAIGIHNTEPKLPIPATNEAILEAIGQITELNN